MPDLAVHARRTPANRGARLIVSAGRAWADRKRSRADLDAIGGTARDVYIRGRGAGYHSSDGGAHWTKVTTIPVKLVDALSWRDGDAIDVLDPATGTVARR